MPKNFASNMYVLAASAFSKVKCISAVCARVCMCPAFVRVCACDGRSVCVRVYLCVC